MQVNDKMITTVNDYIADFKENITMGMEAIRRAAQSYVAALHTHKDAHEKFVQAFPTITERTWGLLVKIGRGEANPNVLVCSTSFGDKVSRLPIKQQDMLLGASSGFVKVYSPKADKSVDVRFGDVTASQERILFDDSTGKIRSVKEQKAYVNALNEAEQVKEHEKSWRIVGNTIIVSRRCEISVGELLDRIHNKR